MGEKHPSTSEPVARRKADNRDPIPLRPGDICRIVMKDRPGPDACMIEIENEEGNNIRPGVLYERSDGKWEIELKIAKE